MKVIYTSHGFHFHKSAPKKNWLLFYPIEFVLAYYTDMIITINHEDYSVIKKFNVKEKRYIPGVGVNVFEIENKKVDRCTLRDKYGIPAEAFLILSIGELSNRKNHEVIINAIFKTGLNDIYYLICGTGSNLEYLYSLCRKLNLSKRVLLVGHVTHDEIKKLCHICDIGALPSKIEGLGLAGIETLAAGKPLVTSNVHGIKDYAIDNITGVTCEPSDSDGFAAAICKLYENKEFYEKCSQNALEKSKEFDILEVKKCMIDNYHYFDN